MALTSLSIEWVKRLWLFVVLSRADTNDLVFASWFTDELVFSMRGVWAEVDSWYWALGDPVNMKWFASFVSCLLLFWEWWFCSESQLTCGLLESSAGCPALLGVFFNTSAANCGGIGSELQILISVEVLMSVGTSPDISLSIKASIDGNDAVDILKSCDTLMFTAVPRFRAPMMPMQRASSLSFRKWREWMQMILCFSPEARLEMRGVRIPVLRERHQWDR
eukprot:scaffold12684_cov45-Cyclotella_meneghiniana.AAC.8